MIHDKIRLYERDNVMWVEIRKNASNSILSYLRTKGFQVCSDKNSAKSFMFCCIREPIERFVSGMNTIVFRRVAWCKEFIKIKQHEEINNIKDADDFLTVCLLTINEMIKRKKYSSDFNAHILPQTHHIKEFDINFYLRLSHLQQDWQELCKIQNWTHERLEHTHIKEPKRRVTAKNALSYILENVEYKHKLEDIYDEDYILYNKLQGEER